MTDVVEVLKAGTVLEQKVRIQKIIGMGRNCVVYAGDHITRPCRVAVKMVRPDKAHVAGAQERFLQAIRAEQELMHPHICAILDQGNHEGIPYAIMERIDGEDLRARVTREGALDYDAILHILDSVLAALGFAHEHNVLHQDVRPERVLLVASDGGQRVKVIGFGCENSDAINGSAANASDLAFCAPEQLRRHAYGCEADLYSVGALAHYLIAGEAPYPQASVQDLIGQIEAETRPRVQTLRHDVPRAMERFVERALAPHPDDRYADATQMREALRRACSNFNSIPTGQTAALLI